MVEPGRRVPPGSEDPEAPLQPERFAWKGALAVAVGVLALVVWRSCFSHEQPVGTSPTASSSASAAPSAAAVTLPRCTPVGAEPFVIGEASAKPKDDDDAQGQEGLSPYAVEVGRAVAYGQGFAAGTLKQTDGSTMAMLATLKADGTGGKLVNLVRSRGDLDPPKVAAAADSLLVAMLEPHAGGRSIKIAKISGENVSWGPEFNEGRDESLALDIAASGSRAIVVWDDVTRDGKRSRVLLASMDSTSLLPIAAARPMSAPKVDAEVPRVLTRPGGYWLVYIARAEEPRKKALTDKTKEPDEDTEAAGETITRQWLEVLPLDETGTSTSVPLAATPKEGHVLAYDVAGGDDGGLLLAYRDDDTPTGSGGGRVATVLVRLGGAGQPQVQADEGIGTGVPSLLPGWLAVANVAGPTRLAAMNAKGELLDDLAPEALLGSGEPIAAQGDALLVAQPAGTAMKLQVVRCKAGVKSNKALSPEEQIPPLGEGDLPPDELDDRAPPADQPE